MKRLGRIVLALYLIASGLIALVPALHSLGQLLPVGAIAAGVLLLLER
jgi:hypothetical protein